MKTNTLVVLWPPLTCTMACVYPPTPTHMHTYYTSCRHTLEKEKEFTLAEVCYRAKCEPALEFFLQASIYISKNFRQHFGGLSKAGNKASYLLSQHSCRPRSIWVEQLQPYFCFLHIWSKSRSPRTTFLQGVSVCHRLGFFPYTSSQFGPSWARFIPP